MINAGEAKIPSGGWRESVYGAVRVCVCVCLH